MVAEILEVVMICSFGLSWPMNVVKSWKARTAKGKSILFMCFILLGYVAGITGKFLDPTYMENFSSKWYVLIFYFINFIMISVDLALYFRNKHLDKINGIK